VTSSWSLFIQLSVSWILPTFRDSNLLHFAPRNWACGCLKSEYSVGSSKRCELHTKTHNVIPQETWIIGDTAVKNQNPARLELYYRLTVAHCASGYWPINKLKRKGTWRTTSKSPLSTYQILSAYNVQIFSKQIIASRSIMSTVMFGKVIIIKSAKQALVRVSDY